MSDHNDIENAIAKFLAKRTNGEVALMAFIAAVLLFTCGIIVGQAIGSL